MKKQIAFIQLPRRFFASKMWKAARTYSECEAWIDLWQSARFEATRHTAGIGGREVTWGRGQFPASIRFLAKRWSWGEQRVRGFLDMLRREQMITTDRSQGMTVITLADMAAETPETTRPATATAVGQPSDEPVQIRSPDTPGNASNGLNPNDMEWIATRVAQLMAPDAPPLQHNGNTKNNNKERMKYNYNKGSSKELPCEADAPHTEQKIDYEALVTFFNEETKGAFGTLRTPLSAKRRGMIHARIREYGKDTFADMIRMAARSPFLKGQNASEWRASFDWLIRPSNFEKIISGNYERHEASQRVTAEGNKGIAAHKSAGNSANNSGFSAEFYRNIAEGMARGRYQKGGE